MSKFVLEIETDNSAFGETDTEFAEEMQRILRRLGDRLVEVFGEQTEFPIHDVFGNRIGTATYRR